MASTTVANIGGKYVLGVPTYLTKTTSIFGKYLVIRAVSFVKSLLDETGRLILTSRLAWSSSRLLDQASLLDELSVTMPLHACMEEFEPGLAPKWGR